MPPLQLRFHQRASLDGAGEPRRRWGSARGGLRPRPGTPGQLILRTRLAPTLRDASSCRHRHLVTEKCIYVLPDNQENVSDKDIKTKSVDKILLNYAASLKIAYS